MTVIQMKGQHKEMDRIQFGRVHCEKYGTQQGEGHLRQLSLGWKNKSDENKKIT